MKEVTYYPVTSGQMILQYSQKFCYKKSINNVCARVDIESEIQEDTMLQAIYISLMRIPCTKVRMHKQDKKTTVQYFSDEVPSGVELRDFSDLTEEEINAKLDYWNQLPFPNNQMDTQLYNIKLLRMPDGTHTIYLCILHLIMDAYAIMSFIKYVEQVYNALLNNTALPKPWPSPLAAYEADYAYFASDRYKKDAEWWHEEFASKPEPMYTSLNGLGGKECPKPGKRTGTTIRLWQVTGLHENLRIPKELVEKAQSTALGWKASPQSMYMLALRTYLGTINNTDDVFIMNSCARRATLVQKRAGGTMVNAVPFRTIIPNDTTFHDAILHLNVRQKEIYKHANYPCAQCMAAYQEAYHISPADGGYHTVSLTFQPYFTAEDGGLQYKFRRLSNGASTLPCYITIMPFDTTGDLWVNYEYTKGFIKVESVQKFHAFMLKFLENGCSNPEATIKELAEMSM